MQAEFMLCAHAHTALFLSLSPLKQAKVLTVRNRTLPATLCVSPSIDAATRCFQSQSIFLSAFQRCPNVHGKQSYQECINCRREKPMNRNGRGRRKRSRQETTINDESQDGAFRVEGDQILSARAAKNLDRLLPVEYEPQPFDVICARGKEAKIHSGMSFCATCCSGLNFPRGHERRMNSSGFSWRTATALCPSTQRVVLARVYV